MPLDEGKAHQLLAEVLRLAKKAAPGAEVSAALEAGRDANTRFANNEITSTGDVEETRVSVQIAFGKRRAAARSNQTDPASLRTTIESAARLAKIAPADPEAMPLLGPQRYLASPSAYDAATDRLHAETRAAAAHIAISAAEAAQVTMAGFYEHDVSAHALANSAGLGAYHLSTSARYTNTARTSDGTGSGWAGILSHRASEIDVGALVKVAVDKALRSAKPRRLEPGRYTVVLEPAAVAELFGFMRGALDARAVDEGRSFFSRQGGGSRLGEKLFSEQVTLRSDPTDRATPAATFDGEGMALKPITWIEGGKLVALRYSRHWANKQGKAPTGQPTTYHLQGGSAGAAQELLRGVKRGVLITHFWYTRVVDPQSILITGLTRDGVFLIENGELSAPVNNFRFNESPVTMLRNADALTRDTLRTPFLGGGGRQRVGLVQLQDFGAGGETRVPALRTHEFNLASISTAV